MVGRALEPRRFLRFGQPPSKQRETSLTECLRFLDPRYPEALKRFDRLRRGILHALENDQSVAGGNDAVVQDLESGADTKALYFRLDHSLRRLHQRLRHFTNAHRQGAWYAFLWSETLNNVKPAA
jgi:hypothetical protein